MPHLPEDASTASNHSGCARGELLPTRAQLYVAPCPHCGAAVPLAPATANAMARPRAPTVPERVRALLASHD